MIMKLLKIFKTFSHADKSAHRAHTTRYEDLCQ